MMRRRLTTLVLLGSVLLALTLGAARPAGARMIVEFEPPAPTDTEIAGPVLVSEDQSINIQGPVITFEQGKEAGAPTVKAPEVEVVPPTS